jgi:RNA polymerase sigma-70 factor (ECF subfamily)
MGENEEPSAGKSDDLRATDTELVTRSQRGDVEAFPKLVDRYAAMLYGLAVSLVGNAADAEDVLQETLLGAFHGLRRFKQRSSVKTWLTRILVRQAASHFRRTKRLRNRVLRLDADSAPETPAAPVSKPGSRMDVVAAIAELTGEHREVIVLRELNGMSYEEIAEVLGIPRGTVESRLFRARRQLQKRLGAYLE